MFDPKKGDFVSVCYDAKWGRARRGKVIQRRGFAILVEFPEYNKNVVTAWFVRTSSDSFGAFVKVEESLMRAMFGLKGDWYSVFSIDVVEKYLKGN